MSGQATGWVLRHGPASPWGVKHLGRPNRAAHAVLVVVADAASKTGTNARAGIAALIARSGYGRSTVFRHLRWLIESGYLVVQEGGGGGPGNLTVFAIPGMTDSEWVPTLPKVESGSQNRTQKGPGSGTQVGPAQNVNGSRSEREWVPLANSTPLIPTVEVDGTTNGPAERPGPQLTLVADAVSPPATDRVRAVFDAWIEATGRTGRTVLDPKRRRLIENALKGYPFDDVLDAVRGWQNSPYHRGENDTGTTYNDLDLLLRNPSKIERFRDLWRNPPKPKARTSSRLATGEILERVVAALQAGKRPQFDDLTEQVIRQMGGWTALRTARLDVLRGQFFRLREAAS